VSFISFLRSAIACALAGSGLVHSGFASTASVDPSARNLLLDAVSVAGDVVAVGERGAIVLSEDKGSTWKRVSVPVSTTLTGVSFAPGSKRGWAVGHQGVILRSEDNGRSWTRQTHREGEEEILLDVLALSDERALAVGAFGFALVTDDGGANWTRLSPIDDDRHINRISQGRKGTLYLCGERGLLLQSEDSGASWKPIPASYDGSFFGVLELADGSLLAHGLRGHAFHSASADSIEWQPLETGVRGLLACAVQIADGRILLAGQARIAVLANPQDQSCRKIDLNVTSAISELLLLSDGTLLSFGEQGVSKVLLP